MSFPTLFLNSQGQNIVKRIKKQLKYYYYFCIFLCGKKKQAAERKETLIPQLAESKLSDGKV